MLTVENIAKICHQANKAYCFAIGDYSQPEWEKAPKWQKDSVINGVHFALNNPGTTPEQSHNSWMIEKKLDGWKYGPVKDPDKKEHPCMVEYSKLPSTHIIKDELFLSIIKTLEPYISIEY